MLDRQQTDLTGAAHENRDTRGRFKRGNRLGRGNPFAHKVNKLRAALLQEVSEKNIRAILKNVVKQAEQGDLAAVKILLDRIFGPPIPADLIQRLEELEQTIGDQK